MNKLLCFAVLPILGTLLWMPTGSVWAQEAAKPPMTGTGDLLGNGKSESIGVKLTNKQEQIVSFTVTIGAAKNTVPLASDYWDSYGGMKVVQIDGDSRTRQVVVTLVGPSDMQELYVFRYDGSRITKIGSFDTHGEVKFPGNGAIYAGQWEGFWMLQDKYAVDVKHGTMRRVKQPLYYVGKTTTVTASFPLRSEKLASSAVVADVAQGSQITVVVYAESVKNAKTGDDGDGWYLIKTQTGLCGWAQLRTFQEKQHGLQFAG